MNIKRMVKDLDLLNNPSPSNICYSDGYYAKSLERKYGKSICELSKIAVEYKRKQRVNEREFKMAKILENLEVDEFGCVKLEDVKKIIGELI